MGQGAWQQASLFELAPQLWKHVPIEDPRARALADRHYSRQTAGADGFVAPGQRFLLLHEGEQREHDATSSGLAVWAVVRNRFRGQYYWRNSLFRNESRTLSSDLIRAATEVSLEIWARRYGALPAEDLITEIDIAATSARRSRWVRPGRCYEAAGWIHVRDLDPGHGRPARAIWRAPRPL